MAFEAIGSLSYRNRESSLKFLSSSLSPEVEMVLETPELKEQVISSGLKAFLSLDYSQEDLNKNPGNELEYRMIVQVRLSCNPSSFG